MISKSARVVLVALMCLLSGCGDVKSVKLSEMNEPKNQKKLLEDLTSIERNTLGIYIVTHPNVDYKMTVGDVLDAAANDEKIKQDAASKVR